MYYKYSNNIYLYIYFFMDKLDLNIENYTYDDILNLFQIDYNFTLDDLKKCKKKVVITHPDKGGNKSLFLLFTNAFNILLSCYKFREKKYSSASYENISYLDDTNYNDKKLIDKINNFNNKENFNELFNDFFEKNKLNNDWNDYGYGNWIKENNVCNEKINNINDMHYYIENNKNRIISTNNNINEYNNNNNFCDLTNSKPDDYGSDLFSKFKYDDLKKAHDESIIPVDLNSINTKNITSFENLKLQRTNDNIKPMNEKESSKYFDNISDKETNLSNKRAYRLYKQQEESEKINKLWLANLNLIKN